MAMPVHHVFYGILALIIAVYSLVGVNLGGFILGMLLASIGAVLVVAWMGPREPNGAPSDTSSAESVGSVDERRDVAETASREGTV